MAGPRSLSLHRDALRGEGEARGCSSIDSSGVYLLSHWSNAATNTSDTRSSAAVWCSTRIEPGYLAEGDVRGIARLQGLHPISPRVGK